MTVPEHTDGTPIAKGEDDDDAYDQYFYEEMAKSRLEGDNSNLANSKLSCSSGSFSHGKWMPGRCNSSRRKPTFSSGLKPTGSRRILHDHDQAVKNKSAQLKEWDHGTGGPLKPKQLNTVETFADSSHSSQLKDENAGKGMLNRSSREGQPVLQSKTSADLVPIRARKILQPVQSQSSSVKQDLKKSSSTFELMSSSKSENMGKAALGNQTDQSHQAGHVEGRASTPVEGKPSVNSKPSASNSPNSSALNLPKHTRISFNGCQYIVLGLIGKGGFSSVYQVGLNITNWKTCIVNSACY